ncbi:MAG: hypothetical protein IKG44_02760 [Mogibacterium sp.]|nr:hypothetical protein [Mogibacterium sp.]
MNNHRFDVGKKFIIKTIIKNDRLKAYRKYIELALEKGYTVCSMIEFYSSPKEGKHFVLRHDVDYSGPSTRKMFDVEKSLGVHSTYYFRKSTIDVLLMNEMIESGFEVGLHYETLSDYAIENNLSEVSNKDIEICRDRLKKEITDFNKLLKKPITSVVAHGANKNREIGKSNNVILDGQSYEEFGIVFEGYDESLYKEHIDTHIMDGNIRHNYGFSYKSNPIEAIEENSKNIVFLAHPNHWYYSFAQRCWNIIALLLGRCSYESNREFLRILDMEAKGNEIL